MITRVSRMPGKIIRPRQTRPAPCLNPRHRWRATMGAMSSQRFRAVVAAGSEDSAVITMPFDPDEAWGAKANHPVGGTIDGCRFRARLVPADRGWVLPLAPKRLCGMGIAI